MTTPGHMPSPGAAPAPPGEPAGTSPNPYSAPASFEGAAVRPLWAGSAPAPPLYRPGGVVGGIAQGLLWADATFHLLAVVFWMVLAHRIRQGNATWAATLLVQAGMLTVITGVAFILTAIFFTIWFHQAYRNLLALGRSHTEFAPWWAAAGFYIPIANLWVPYLLAREAWVHSDPQEISAIRGGLLPPSRSAPLVGAWWLLLLGGQILSHLATAVAGNLTRNLTGALWLQVTSNTLYVAAALCAAWMLRGLERRQRNRHARLHAAPQTP